MLEFPLMNNSNVGFRSRLSFPSMLISTDLSLYQLLCGTTTNSKIEISGLVLSKMNSPSHSKVLPALSITSASMVF